MPIIRKLFLIVLAVFVGRIRRSSRNYIKIETAKAYLKSIAFLRRSTLAIWLMLTCIFFSLMGFGMILIGLFMYIPWSLEAKALALLIVGAVCFSVPLVSFFLLTSEKLWMKHFHADRVLRELPQFRNQP